MIMPTDSLWIFQGSAGKTGMYWQDAVLDSQSQNPDGHTRSCTNVPMKRFMRLRTRERTGFANTVSIDMKKAKGYTLIN